MKRATIFNIQRFSIQDGPGIRSTVFLKGCPLRCLWCSNPESQERFPQVSHRNLLCSECQKCVETCALSAISVEAKKITIDREKCNNCGECVAACAYGALRSMGTLMTVDEVLQEVLRDIDFYRTSGGGLSASGGEPCMQGAFLATLYERAKQAGLHTTLDTCGYANTSVLRRVLEFTDLVLFDIKLVDDQLHRQFTRRSNTIILRNAREVDALGVSQIIRVPLIPSVNCFEQNFRDIACFVRGFRHRTPVNILPYHRMGLSKYEALDRRYALGEEEVLPNDDVQRIRDIFLNEGIECEICQ